MAAYEWEELKAFLDSKVDQYNQPGFVENDPIVIPHAYSKKEDIEITSFLGCDFSLGPKSHYHSKMY